MKQKPGFSAVALMATMVACGDDGAAGEKGEGGLKNDDSAVSAQGPQGDTGAPGGAGMRGAPGENGADGQDLVAAPKLIRLATLPLGAELTGMEKSDHGDFFFNVQHPDSSLPGDDGKAALGAWVNVDVDALDPRMESLSVPAEGSQEAMTTRVAFGTYQVLGREGDTFSNQLSFGLGAIVDAAGNALVKQSNNPDFNAFIPANADGSVGFLFSAWEDRPGAMSRLGIERGTDGTWSVTSALNVDFSAVRGTMINCFGSVSPWGTPLTSEENYEAENTVRWNDASYESGYPNFADVQKLKQYLGGTFPNPYDYGYIVEITEPSAARPVPVKHYTLGRMAHENAVVMPDRRTVYLTDDGSNKAFYKFIADHPDDLSAGTLYAAKVVQDATRKAEKAGFDITWFKLAHATNTEIAGFIADYNGIDESDFAANRTSYISDAEIATWASGGATDDRVAFLETLRAAKAKGATVEFHKMEGIAINPHGAASFAVPFMYVAMADVTGAMSDSEGDIQVEANRCGVLYRLGLAADYDVRRMDPVLVGGSYDATATQNRCDANGIAQPDNVTVLNDGRVLVGEDSSNHTNNMLWLFNPHGT